MASWSNTTTLLLSLLLTVPLLCALAGDHRPPKPILTRLAKDPSTSLYAASFDNGAPPLVLDLAGPLIWSACSSPHRTIPCSSSVCRIAKRDRSSACPDGGRPGSGDGRRCACAACPCNPASGQCGSGELTAVTLSANATDGKNPLFPVSFAAVASCAPAGLLASLPFGAGGVVGLSRAPLSLPSQVAAKLNVAKQFALCLPSGGDVGAAIFGGGPFSLQAAPPQQVISDRLRYTPLLKNRKNGGAYYIGVTAVAVNEAQVLLPPGALALNARGGHGGVALSTAAPYTALRADIYRPLLRAFDAATPFARAPPAKPFDLCYNTSALPSTRVGYYTAAIDLTLAGGHNWTLVGSSLVVEVSQDTACFAFVEMGSAPAAGQSPAVVIGGHQMEDTLVAFDLEKAQFGFSGLLLGTMTTCSNFNFTMGSQ